MGRFAKNGTGRQHAHFRLAADFGGAVRAYFTMGSGFWSRAAFDIPSPGLGVFRLTSDRVQGPASSAAVGQTIGVMIYGGAALVCRRRFRDRS